MLEARDSGRLRLAGVLPDAWRQAADGIGNHVVAGDAMHLLLHVGVVWIDRLRILIEGLGKGGRHVDEAGGRIGRPVVHEIDRARGQQRKRDQGRGEPMNPQASHGTKPERGAL